MRYTLLLLVHVIAVAFASAGDWPGFHGPNRDNKSTDKGLLKAWPEGGPSHIWEAAGIGEGYSTVSIVGKSIYTAGAIDDVCVITALDMDGKRVWTRKNGKAWKGSYPGKRPTWAYPVVYRGRLYLRYGDKLGVYDVSAGVSLN